LASALIKSNEAIRRSHITIKLGNLVFENQVVTKRIPREIRNHPMILMPVGPVMRENEIRYFDVGLQFFEILLDGEVIRKKAVAKLPDDDMPSSCTSKKQGGAPLGFWFATARRRENDPRDLNCAMTADQLQNQAAAADFDVVRVRAEAHNSQGTRSGAKQVERVHPAVEYTERHSTAGQATAPAHSAPTPTPFHTSHGALPRA